MRIDILTLFPEMFTPLTESVIGRAVKSGKIEIVVTDIRDYTENKHRKCDDYPFGGGAGMVMTPQPVYSAIQAVDPDHKAHRVFTSPKGRRFTQSMVGEFLKYDRILFLCGHYEGVDQRVIDMCIDEEVSLGDFVLTGGEIPAYFRREFKRRKFHGRHARISAVYPPAKFYGRMRTRSFSFGQS